MPEQFVDKVEALAPCPFCGKAPREVDDDSYGHNAVGCIDCDVWFDGFVSEGLDGPRDMWNRRALISEAPADPLRERLAALVTRLEGVKVTGFVAPGGIVVLADVVRDFRALLAEAAPERREGHSKLVYNKQTRTIDTVDPHPEKASGEPVKRWKCKGCSAEDISERLLNPSRTMHTFQHVSGDWDWCGPVVEEVTPAREGGKT